jgi:hypothetical protein
MHEFSPKSVDHARPPGILVIAEIFPEKVRKRKPIALLRAVTAGAAAADRPVCFGKNCSLVTDGA